METLLKGTCSKTNLMDIFENFTFLTRVSRLVKIVARNHQYLGVSRAIDAVVNRSKRLGKLGFSGTPVGLRSPLFYCFFCPDGASKARW